MNLTQVCFCIYFIDHFRTTLLYKPAWKDQKHHVLKAQGFQQIVKCKSLWHTLYSNDKDVKDQGNLSIIYLLE